jgi:hypothetical protein
MRTFFLALAVMVQSFAWGCPVLSEEQSRTQLREDLDEQRRLAVKLAQDADLVVLARVTSISVADNTARVLVTKLIKGDATPGAVLVYAWRPESEVGFDTHVFSCTRSAAFMNVQLVENIEYVLYVKGSSVTRAAELERDEFDIPFAEEESLIRGVPARDNSLGP